MHPIFEKICDAISGEAMERAKRSDVYEVAAERLRTIDTAKTVSHEEMKERFSDSDAELLISELSGGEK